MKNSIKIILFIFIILACIGAASDNPSFENSTSTPARSAVLLVPHNSNELVNISKAIYIGGAGNLEVILADSPTAVVFKGLSAGQILPIRARVVKASLTTATDIISLY